jgi:hypothetical protein
LKVNSAAKTFLLAYHEYGHARWKYSTTYNGRSVCLETLFKDYFSNLEAGNLPQSWEWLDSFDRILILKVNFIHYAIADPTNTAIDYIIIFVFPGLAKKPEIILYES